MRGLGCVGRGEGWFYVGWRRGRGDKGESVVNLIDYQMSFLAFALFGS